MKTAFRLALSLSPVLFASCVLSEKPLTDESNSKPDAKLIGTWHQVKDSGPTYVMTIGRKADEPKVLQWVSTTLNKRKRVMVQKHNVFTTGGKGKLISIAVRDDLNVIGKYVLEKKTLKLFLLDPQFLGKAVDAGKLKGTAKKKGNNYGTVALKDSSENLRKFINKNLTKCFRKEPTVFKKIGS